MSPKDTIWKEISEKSTEGLNQVGFSPPVNTYCSYFRFSRGKCFMGTDVFYCLLRQKKEQTALCPCTCRMFKNAASAQHPQARPCFYRPRTGSALWWGLNDCCRLGRGSEGGGREGGRGGADTLPQFAGCFPRDTHTHTKTPKAGFFVSVRHTANLPSPIRVSFMAVITINKQKWAGKRPLPLLTQPLGSCCNVEVAEPRRHARRGPRVFTQCRFVAESETIDLWGNVGLVCTWWVNFQQLQSVFFLFFSHRFPSAIGARAVAAWLSSRCRPTCQILSKTQIMSCRAAVVLETDMKAAFKRYCDLDPSAARKTWEWCT